MINVNSIWDLFASSGGHPALQVDSSLVQNVYELLLGVSAKEGMPKSPGIATLVQLVVLAGLVHLTQGPRWHLGDLHRADAIAGFRDFESAPRAGSDSRRVESDH